jgi:hypothetical protein
MMLSDMPTLRAALEKFTDVGNDLVETLDAYERSGNPVPGEWADQIRKTVALATQVYEAGENGEL